MTVLSIAPHVDLKVVGEYGIVATTGAGQYVFSGAIYASIADAVNGDRSESEILEAIPLPGAAEAIEVLRSAGVLVEADATLPAAMAAFWAAEGVSPRRVTERLAATSINIAVVGEGDDSEVRRLLSDAGATVADDGDLTLVLAEDYLHDDLSRYNERALATGRPWMLATGARLENWIGPVFDPDRGPCWECLAQRLRLHRRLETYLREAEIPVATPTSGGGTLPSGESAVAAMIATAALRWIVLERASGLSDAVLSVDTRLWQTQSHALAWRPQCRVCGVPEPSTTVAARPIDLAAAGQRLAPAGTLRTVTPDVTLERFSNQVSPITGIVDRIVRSPSAHPPLHAYIAAAPEPRVHGEDRSWIPFGMTPSGGKGPTDEQARASALCEALERYSGRFGGEEPRLVTSYEELGDRAVHPNDVMGFSDEQYRSREATNATARSLRTFVPVPFDPAANIEWTPVWSLSGERERLLPTALCYYDAPGAEVDGCIGDSNGNAAGNTIEEAILHGFLELVERDHVALWWYNRLRQPGMDIASFGDPWLEQVQARFAAEDREFWALDLTADLRIPTVVAVATPPGEPDGEVSFGFGAHLDHGLALQRAAAELVQLGSGVPSAGLGHGAGEPLRPGDQPYLRPDPDAPKITPDTSTTTLSGDLRIDIDACRAAVEDRGMEMMVLDQTRADVGLPVVKVIVPGMRHFWPRFGPGRLYEVPVALGRLPKPLAESDLNPISPTA